jgi:HD-GYP domain-containing protein (c-di-GMP phosphodiesterase class II)
LIADVSEEEQREDEVMVSLMEQISGKKQQEMTIEDIERLEQELRQRQEQGTLDHDVSLAKQRHSENTASSSKSLSIEQQVAFSYLKERVQSKMSKLSADKATLTSTTESKRELVMQMYQAKKDEFYMSHFAGADAHQLEEDALLNDDPYIENLKYQMHQNLRQIPELIDQTKKLISSVGPKETIFQEIKELTGVDYSFLLSDNPEAQCSSLEADQQEAALEHMTKYFADEISPLVSELMLSSSNGEQPSPDTQAILDNLKVRVKELMQQSLPTSNKK